MELDREACAAAASEATTDHLIRSLGILALNSNDDNRHRAAIITDELSARAAADIENTDGAAWA